MRNQQIKKVNRIFFSGQDEEKRKWIEQMAAEGWQLISGNSFVYSFQRVSSELAENQSSYKSVLGTDLQKSMPLVQDSSQNWPPLLSERKIDRNNKAFPLLLKENNFKPSTSSRTRHIFYGTMAFLLFVVVFLAKIAVISHGNFISLFKWQLFTGFLMVGFSMAVGVVFLLKGFLRLLALECKTKK